MILSSDRRSALEHVTKATDISVVIGYAGTGKSACSVSCARRGKGAGYTVHGIALSVVAAQNLESGSDIASRTIASMEHHGRMAVNCSTSA